MNTLDTLNISCLKRKIPYPLLFVFAIIIWFIVIIPFNIFLYQETENNFLIMLQMFSPIIISFILLYLYTALSYRKNNIHAIKITPTGLNIQWIKKNIFLLWHDIQSVSYMFYTDQTVFYTEQTEKMYIERKTGGYIIVPFIINTENKHNEDEWRLKIISLLEKYTTLHQIQFDYCENDLNHLPRQVQTKDDALAVLMNIKFAKNTKIPKTTPTENIVSAMILVLVWFILTLLLILLISAVFTYGEKTDIANIIFFLCGLFFFISLWISLSILIIKRIKLLYKR
ncbi:MAG: hypothetical protein J6W29_09450 [Neisseriaceae bacterium]|nr:hypothetical protein [Neisseriaceae bacterium]